MPTTALTAAPAPQLAPAARVIERDDGCLQIGIRPETYVRVSDTASLREALVAITHGERRGSHPELLAALDGSGLFATPQPPGPFPVRLIGSVEGDVEGALEWVGIRVRPRAGLALVLSTGEIDRTELDPLVRSDLPHLVLRAIDGVVVLGPFVVPGATACLRCLDAHHSDEDPGYPVALERYVAAGTQPREDGCLDVPDPGNIALALAWAARDLRTFSTGGVPTTWSSTIAIGGIGAPIAQSPGSLTPAAAAGGSSPPLALDATLRLVNDLPRKAAARTARIAALPLGYAGRSALGFGKRLGGAAPEVVMTEIQQRTAEQLFRTLGELKGGAMKMGQALSIFEAALPDAVAEPYREQLTRLQDSAPPMPTITIREQLTRQLGPEWSEHLTFDPMASAAASIGQVHRGTWRDAADATPHDVAVKVQYPGAAEAMEADLRQLQRLARTLGPLVPGIDVKALVTELRERTVEELDYEREADAQRRFADAFRDDPDYVIPDVIARGGTVLVTEWMDSPASLARTIGEGTQEERNHYGLLYARFLFGAPLRTGMLHADPHPGNFRLLSDRIGPLGVLDFGAVARLRDNQLPPVVGTLLRAAVDDDYERLHDELVAGGFIRERIRVDVDQLRNYLAPFIEPAQADSFAFSRRWMRRQFRRVSDPGGDAQSTMLRLNLPPEYLLIHRTWTGAIAVLSQLGAELPFRALLEESVPGFARP